jgi:hypothetical protein
VFSIMAIKNFNTKKASRKGNNENSKDLLW